jgi:hypothetical protein
VPVYLCEMGLTAPPSNFCTANLKAVYCGLVVSLIIGLASDGEGLTFSEL